MSSQLECDSFVTINHVNPKLNSSLTPFHIANYEENTLLIDWIFGVKNLLLCSLQLLPTINHNLHGQETFMDKQLFLETPSA